MSYLCSGSESHLPACGGTCGEDVELNPEQEALDMVRDVHAGRRSADWLVPHLGLIADALVEAIALRDVSLSDCELDTLNEVRERGGLLWRCKVPSETQGGDECYALNWHTDDECYDCGAARPKAAAMG